MEIEKLIDIKILCGQIIEKVNELLEEVDAEDVDIKTLSENMKLRTDEANAEDTDIKELSESSKYSTQDDLLNESIKNSVDNLLSNDEDYNLEKSVDDITNSSPEDIDFVNFSEKADSAVYKTEDDKLNEAIEVSNIIINDSTTDKSEDVPYSEMSSAITQTSPVVE